MKRIVEIGAVFLSLSFVSMAAGPSEVADAVLFFASGRSDYLTGQVLSVSGGLTMAD